MPKTIQRIFDDIRAMHIWNIKALATQLRDGTLSERERMKYYLVFMVVVPVGAVLPSNPPEPVSPALVAAHAVGIVATVVGIYVTYLANRRGDDKDFIARSICLMLPVMIRVMAVWLPVGMCYLILGSLISGDAFDTFAERTSWFDVVFSAALLIFFYWYLWRHITWIARPKDVTDTSGASVGAPSGRDS